MNFRITVGIALLALPFALAAQEPTPASTPAAASRASSKDIEIGDLIARFAKRTGRQFIVDPRVRGEVPLAGQDPDRIDYARLLAILAVNALVAVPQGDWIVVVPDTSARQLPTPVYTDRDFKAGAPDEVATLVLTPRNVCAPQAVPVLRPLMPQAGHLAAYPDTNTLILSDRVANLHRLVAVIAALERAGEKDPVSAAECAERFGAKGTSSK